MKRKLIILWVVLCISYVFLSAQHVYYVAPTGNDNNAGTLDAPWGTWQKAFDSAQPGDTVYFRGGVWYPTTQESGNNITVIATSGTPTNRICFFNYPGENPILDCSRIDLTGHNYNTAVYIEAQHFLSFRGLTVRNVQQPASGMVAVGILGWACSNFHYENVTVHNVGGRGFSYIGSTGYNGVVYDSTFWINCDAYNNIDTLSAEPGNAGDGWKTDQEKGSYLYWYGCRSWNNSDDGFDASGPTIGVFDHCWAFNMQYPDALDGNGFKFGAVRDSISEPSRIVKNCLSAFNIRLGLYDLEYPDYYRNNSRVYNNTVYKCGIGISISDNADRPGSLSRYFNNIVYNVTTKDVVGRPYILDLNDFYTESHNTWDYAESGSLPNWTTTDTVTVTDNDFVLTDSIQGLAQLMAPRKADGSLPDITFLKLATGSDLIDAGFNVGLPYAGSAPDIGAFEYGLTSGIKINKEQPGESLFIQNYPNPFSTSTTITYQLLSKNYVRLTVFDISGKIVATLVDEVQQPGTQSVRFNAGNLESGIYFYSITAGTFNETKKLILTK